MPVEGRDPNYNSWEFSRGLREEGIFNIHMAYFGTDAAYNDGQTMLMILEGSDEEGEDWREILSCGEKWETLDGGKTIEYPGKPNRHFNQNSMYAIWCREALVACEKAKSDYLDKHIALEADTWIDTRWAMKEKIASKGFKRRDGEVVEDRIRLLPDEFLGMTTEDQRVENETKAQHAAQTETPEQKRARLLAWRVDRNQPPPRSRATIESVLVVVAKESTFEQFVEQALGLDDVLADDSLAASVVDNSPDGFYARHHA